MVVRRGLESELGEDDPDVSLDRSLGQTESVGDREVRAALGHQLEDLQLTRCQLVERARGQGYFIRVPVKGVVLLDVGRLVFDPETGNTLFQSAGVIPFDEDTEAATDAAVCSLFD